MADKGYCVITLQKEVPDRETARLLYDMIKIRLADHPEITINGHFSNHFDLKLES